MVWTNLQLTAFWENADQMAICHRTRLQLQEEGINDPEDLKLFKADGFKKLAESLKHPSGTEPDPDPAAASAGETIPKRRFAMGATSWLRLEHAANLVRHYAVCNRPLTVANMQWSPVIESYYEYWESLETQLKDSPPVLPKITKALPLMQWQDAFDSYLSRVHGARSVPLTYVIREKVAIANPLPDLVQHQVYSAENGSAEKEMVATANHTSGLYRIDNARVYYALTQATLGTSYASSVTPFANAQNGRAAYMALQSQFAGPDKWQDLLRKQKDFLQNRKWTGQQNMTLETFVSQHRQAHVLMTQCQRHITVELPTEYSRVTALLDSIECDNSRLQAALSQVRTDDSATGLHHNFEQAVIVILPQDPVALKRVTGKRSATAMISEVTGGPSPTLKVGKGKTGVELRFHKRPEYLLLTQEQQKELKDFRDERVRQGHGRGLSGGPPMKKGRNNKSSKNKGKGKDNTAEIQSMISAAVAAAHKASAKTAAKDDTDLRTQLQALVSSMNSGPASTNESDSTGQVGSTAAVATRANPLQSILRRARPG